MKIISEKESVCTTRKVLKDHDEHESHIFESMKKEGFHIVKIPNYYDGYAHNAVKYTKEGIVYTFIKYESK